MNNYPHPLYPSKDDKKFKTISLYEPKECMLCKKWCNQYVWKDVTTSESDYLIPGTQTTTKFMRVCIPCTVSRDDDYMWETL